MTSVTNFNFRGADVRTMSSREIAELTGKQHFHVMRDIRAMLAELQVDESTFGCSYKDGAGRLQRGKT